MIRSGEVPAGISMRAKWTLTPSGTTRGYQASTTLLTLGTLTPSRMSPVIAPPPPLLDKRPRMPLASRRHAVAVGRDHDTIAGRGGVAALGRSGAGGHLHSGREPDRDGGRRRVPWD